MQKESKWLLIGHLLAAEDVVGHVRNLSWDVDTSRNLEEALRLIRLSVVDMERSTADEA